MVLVVITVMHHGGIPIYGLKGGQVVLPAARKSASRSRVSLSGRVGNSVQSRNVRIPCSSKAKDTSTRKRVQLFSKPYGVLARPTSETP